MSTIVGRDRSVQAGILAAAVVGLVAVAVAGANAGNIRIGAAALVGGFAGLALYHASFGFTAAWRRVVTDGRGAGLRAQFLLIALTALVSFPLIAYGRDFGVPTGGFVFPFGVAAAIGATMFGFGMQLGGGCGSGTLFTAGGGSDWRHFELTQDVMGPLADAVT